MSTIKEDSRFLLTISQGERRSDASENGVIRSVSEFRILDVALRTSAAAEEEGMLDLAAFPESVDTESLQVYMQYLLGTPKVVHSDALASFLTVVKDEQEDHPPDLEFVQYLLPGIQSPTFEPIPRFGSYQKAMDTILPGWWLVWYLALEGAETAVDFQVYTCGSGEAGGAAQELVHQEICTSLSTTRIGDRRSDYYFGSYRVLSESKLALLKVTGRSVLVNSGGRKVFVDCAAIPHEAFKAACTAAKDANTSAKRRRQAPLLSVILNHPSQATVCVQREKNEEQDDKAIPSEKEVKVVDVDQLTALQEQFVILEQRASRLEAERDQVKEELTASSASVKEMTEKVTLAESERRVWNMVRAELQSELSRLSHGLEQEKSDKARVAQELQDTQQELQEVTVRLKLLELQSPGAVSSNGTESQLAELSSATRKLENDLKSETRKNETLEASIASIEQAAKERVLKAMDEAHQAKMNQRRLSSQVHQLEEEKCRIRNCDSAPATFSHPSKQKVYRALDDDVASFQHPDPRLNAQLSTLRDRHQKINIMLAQNPSNTKNVEILLMLEKAIVDIVAAGKA